MAEKNDIKIYKSFELIYHTLYLFSFKENNWSYISNKAISI